MVVRSLYLSITAVLAVFALLLGCSGFPGTPKDAIDIEITVRGVALPPESTATASYLAARPLLTPSMFIRAPTKERPYDVVISGDRATVASVGTSLTSMVGFELRGLHFDSAGERFRINFSKFSVPTAPPPDPSGISGIDNAQEFAQNDGTVARFSSHSAFLPTNIRVNLAGLERIEITIDAAMVPETLFLDTSSMFGLPLLGWGG